MRLRLLIATLFMLVISTLGASSVFAADKKIKVVTTFSILHNLTAEIAGDTIELETLVGADTDSHIFSPSPKDILKVAKADLLIVNGLGFEGWIARLQQASGFKGEIVIASNNITHLDNKAKDTDRDNHSDHGKTEKHDDHGDHNQHRKADNHDDHDGHNHGAIDPHAWHSIPNVKTYVRNITQALSKADPKHSDNYQQRSSNYLEKLNKLDTQLREKIAALPKAKRTIITSHDAFGYLAHEYGLVLKSPQGKSTKSEPSAKEIARIIKQIRAEHITAVFLENVSNDRLIKQITRETDAVIGGKLYSDALSNAEGEAPNYIKMMQHNITTITQALSDSASK